MSWLRKQDNQKHHILHDIRVASPCPVKWENMSGDERKRLCSACNIHVFNIEQMTSDEIQTLVGQSTEQRTCIRLLRRTDGTVVTRECPFGLRAIRRNVRLFYTVVTAIVAGVIAVMCGKTTVKQAVTETYPKIAAPQTGMPTYGLLDPHPAVSPDPVVIAE